MNPTSSPEAEGNDQSVRPESEYILGIDAGGTHTDAVLLRRVSGNGGPCFCLMAGAKVPTCHTDLPSSLASVLDKISDSLGPDGRRILAAVSRVTLGTTLAVNALVQNRADRVGLALSAGPGLDPARFGLGDSVCIVPGGLDHRGTEVTRLDTAVLENAASEWRGKGIAAFACVGKFSPRNPAHEKAMADCLQAVTGQVATCGHRLSGQLNFPRRVATAYYNAATSRIANSFLDAVESALKNAGVSCPTFLLKADGGAEPIAVARRAPVQSILSGPAASVMGILALADSLTDDSAGKCSLLLDIGGTTTDMAVILDGSPVLDRDGMVLGGRRTLVRSLAQISIGIGGDSQITVRAGRVETGPERNGPAMAFGGSEPSLLDALNYLDQPKAEAGRGDLQASVAGINALASENGLTGKNLASLAVENALARIVRASQELLEKINSRPIYTLAALRSVRLAQPGQVWLVGGPADCLRQRLEKALAMPVRSPAHAAVANAVGAALTLPTAGLEIYADTGKGLLRTPFLDREEKIPRNYSLEAAKTRASELLQEYLAGEGIADATVQVVEADIFATLDDGGYGSKDIRVACQAVPGIAGHL